MLQKLSSVKKASPTKQPQMPSSHTDLPTQHKSSSSHHLVNSHLDPLNDSLPPHAPSSSSIGNRSSNGGAGGSSDLLPGVGSGGGSEAEDTTRSLWTDDSFLDMTMDFTSGSSWAGIAHNQDSSSRPTPSFVCNGDRARGGGAGGGEGGDVAVVTNLDLSSSKKRPRTHSPFESELPPSPRTVTHPPHKRHKPHKHKSGRVRPSDVYQQHPHASSNHIARLVVRIPLDRVRCVREGGVASAISTTAAAGTTVGRCGKEEEGGASGPPPTTEPLIVSISRSRLASISAPSSDTIVHHNSRPLDRAKTHHHHHNQSHDEARWSHDQHGRSHDQHGRSHDQHGKSHDQRREFIHQSKPEFPPHSAEIMFVTRDRDQEAIETDRPLPRPPTTTTPSTTITSQRRHAPRGVCPGMDGCVGLDGYWYEWTEHIASAGDEVTIMPYVYLEDNDT